MANFRITELPPITAVNSTDVFPVVNSSFFNNYSTTAQISAGAAAASFSKLLSLPAYNISLSSFQPIVNSNVVTGSATSILGGLSNTADGDSSSIIGGKNNNTNNKYNVFILGSNITATTDNYTYVNNLSSQGYLYGDGTYITNVPGAVATYITPTPTLTSTFIPGYNSALGSSPNIANTVFSFIAGGSGNYTKGFINTFILGTALTASAANYTYVNNISSPGLVAAAGGNSNTWNTAYTLATGLTSLSGNWQNTYTSVTANSANWGTAYTLATGLTSLSSNWQNTYTTVNTNSGSWAAGGSGGGGVYRYFSSATGALTASIIPLSGGNTASGTYSLVAAGSSNNASGFFSNINGGSNNKALSAFNIVAGGYQNVASGLYANVNGGTVNVAASAWATVGGGNVNQALSGYAVVAGGWSNCANNWATSIGGGYGNVASGTGSSIGGGANNTASGNYSKIGGGYNNNVIGNYSSVVGGTSNTSSGNYSTVAAGSGNNAQGNRSFIGSGCGNLTSNTGAVILAGRSNYAGGQSALVTTGTSNSATNTDSMVLGGVSNLAANTRDTIINGCSNIACGVFSTIGNGSYNQVLSSYDFIGSGAYNTASGCYSTVVNGVSNVISAPFTFIAGGSGNCTTAPNTFILGSGLYASVPNYTYLNNLSVQGTQTIITTNSATSPFNNNLLSLVGAASGSVYKSVQNLVAGASASADISLYNDQSQFIDVGIASSLYNGNAFTPSFTTVGPGDGYIYTTTNNLAVGTAGATGNINFFTGGTLSASNTKATISNSGLTVNGGISAISPGNQTIFGNNSLYGITTAQVNNSSGTTPITSVNLMANTVYKIYGTVYALTQAQPQLFYSGNVINTTISITYSLSTAPFSTGITAARNVFYISSGTGSLVSSKNFAGFMYEIGGTIITSSAGTLTLQLSNYGTVTNSVAPGAFLQAMPVY